MLGQLGIIIVGFADNIMVGHHSTAELAAASFVNNFFNLAFIFGMGFSYGLTPIIGGLHANKEYHKAGETLKNSLFINFIVGVLLSTLMLLLLLNIDILKQPEELMHNNAQLPQHDRDTQTDCFFIMFFVSRELYHCILLVGSSA